MMIFMNSVTKSTCPIEYAEGFIKMFSCICPHVGEELWAIQENTLSMKPSYSINIDIISRRIRLLLPHTS